MINFKTTLKDLRDKITNIQDGPIIKNKGTIIFNFKDRKYIAPEPVNLLFGFNKESDKNMALETLLNKTAILLIL